MAYDKKKIHKQAIEAIEKRKLFFIEDVVVYIPIAKKTLYEWWPIGSYESNTIKEALEKNKIEIKVSMRSKWYKSNNPTLQMGLMKLIGTDEEAHRLNGSNQIAHITLNDTRKTVNELFPSEDELDESEDKSKS